MRHAVLRLLLLLVLVPALALALTGPASASPTRSSDTDERAGVTAIPGLPLLSPPGSNNFNCRPTAGQAFSGGPRARDFR